MEIVNNKMIKPIAILPLVFGAVLGFGQIPNAPQPKPRFWTPEMKIDAGVLVAESIVDGYTTQKYFQWAAQGRGITVERDPLARPFVTHGIGGQVVACAIGDGAVLGTSYLLYKMRHPKLARWVLRISVTAEGYNAVHQIQGLK